VLDVPGDEPGHPRPGRALRVHVEPQLRGAPGPWRPHPSREPADGGRRCDRGTFRRHPGVVMNAVNVIEGPVSVLDRTDVDTDQIMPKEFLKRIERTGFGEFLFHDWRRNEPDFPLERPEFRHAPIRATGAGFGSGSSREHAPWGLVEWGFRAIVAPSFGDIFRN